jgi:hypothetical protein
VVQGIDQVRRAIGLPDVVSLEFWDDDPTRAIVIYELSDFDDLVLQLRVAHGIAHFRRFLRPRPA